MYRSRVLISCHWLKVLKALGTFLNKQCSVMECGVYLASHKTWSASGSMATWLLGRKVNSLMASHFLWPQLHLISSSNFTPRGTLFLFIAHQSIRPVLCRGSSLPTAKASGANHRSVFAEQPTLFCSADEKWEKSLINSFLASCGVRN